MLKSTLLVSLLLACSPALADLGPAMTTQDGVISDKIYEAWCGTKGRKECSVQFNQGVMAVNNSTGITSSQVLKITAQWKWHEYHKHLDGNTCNPVMNTHCQRHFWIEFRGSNGIDQKALFRYAHRLTAEQFQNDLEAWTGEPLRLIGPIIKVVQ